MPSDGDANSGATASATAPSASIMASSFMCNVSLPPKLEIHSGKLSKEWKQWRQVWDAYEEVTNLRSKTSRLHVATFITCIGKEALEIHNGLPFRSEEEKSDITKVLYGCRNVAKFDKSYFHSIKIYLHSIKIIFIR